MLSMAVSTAGPALAQDERTADAGEPPDGVGLDVPAEPAEDERAVYVAPDGTIVVTVRPPRGSVIGNIPPEEILDAEAIRALGASDVGELIQLLRPQLGNAPGDETIVLLNGRRVASFASIAIYPREAIERTEILPPHVASSYGYPAGGRVINVVLRENYRGGNAELASRFATDGGRAEQEAKAVLLTVSGDNRLTFNVQVRREDALFESERGIVQPVPTLPFDLVGNVTAVPPSNELDPALSAIAGRPVTIAGVPLSALNGAATPADFAQLADAANVTDLGRFRTLLPATERIQLSAELARLIGEVAATATARYVGSVGETQLGLASARLLVPAANPFSPFGNDVFLYRYLAPADPLSRQSESHAVQLSLNLAGALSGWRWTYTATLDHSRNEARTGTGVDVALAQDRIDGADPTLNPFSFLDRDIAVAAPPDRAQTSSTRIGNRLWAAGTLLRLPAGPARAQVSATHDVRVTDTATERGGNRLDLETTRQRLRGDVNLTLPITSRQQDVARFAGDFALLLNAAVEGQSRSSTLMSLGYGARWTPVDGVHVSALVQESERSLDEEQLTAPRVELPNARVFDFRLGETVEVVQISGGNPALLAPRIRNVNLRLVGELARDPGLVVAANYTSSAVRNLTGNLSSPIPEIEAAFPERFFRDASARLVRFDSRPINFASSKVERIGASVNFSMALGTRRPPPARAATAPGAAGRSAVPARRPAPAPVPPPGRGRQASRLLASVNYQHLLSSTILVREGIPRINLFESAYAGGDGRARHQLNYFLGISRDGWQARIEGNWESGRTVRSGQSRLDFSALSIVNLQASFDLDARPGWVRRTPFLQGTSIRLDVSNLFNSRQRVRDENGQTPLAYQPAYLDPLGRAIRLTLRKAF